MTPCDVAVRDYARPQEDRRATVTLWIGVIGTGFMGRTWSSSPPTTSRKRRTWRCCGWRAAQLGRDYGADVEPTPEALLGGRTWTSLSWRPSRHPRRLRRGRQSGGVLVEKPMTVSVAEAERMVATTEGRVLAVCSQHRFGHRPSRRWI
jgi:hypothetical protein